MKAKQQEKVQPAIKIHKMEEKRLLGDEGAEFIENLIRKRKKLGITQENLAEMTGLNQAAIGRLESMKTNPTLKTVLKILNALDMKLMITGKE